MSKSEVEDYLKSDKRRIVILIGPNGYYLLDGHHLSRSLLEANIWNDVKDLYCEVVENWSNLSEEDFLYKMVSSNYVWLYDEKGSQPVAPGIFFRLHEQHATANGLTLFRTFASAERTS